MKRKKTISSATRAKADKPKTHDDYLATVSEEKRTALRKLRKAINAAAPKAEECISYQLPAFRLNGIPCRLWRGCEPLRVLSWVCDHQP
jgi:hypothetical protein